MAETTTFQELPVINRDFSIIKFIDTNYPETTDCIYLDAQIGNLSKVVVEINKRIDTTKYGFSSDQHYTWLFQQRYRDNLVNLLNAKRNKQIQLDCRNQIETKRQEETAQVFTESSVKAEERILGDTKKKQYTLAIVGAVVLLTSLVVLLMQKKKKK